MTEVTRYDTKPGSSLIENPQGDWVSHEDYETLRADRDEAYDRILRKEDLMRRLLNIPAFMTTKFGQERPVTSIQFDDGEGAWGFLDALAEMWKVIDGLPRPSNEDRARRLAEYLNGGDFYDKRWYTEEQRNLWRKHAQVLYP